MRWPIGFISWLSPRSRSVVTGLQPLYFLFQLLETSTKRRNWWPVQFARCAFIPRVDALGIGLKALSAGLFSIAADLSPIAPDTAPFG